MLILMLGIISPGCSLLHKSSRKKADQKTAQKAELNKKEYDTGIKQHVKNQSAQTKKMMKQAKKNAKKLNRGKAKNHSRKNC